MSVPSVSLVHHHTSSSFADSFGNLIERMVKAAEMEATLKRLLAEIEATKRRVNALEFKVIPELEEARVFIQLRLEEMEREETFRLGDSRISDLHPIHSLRTDVPNQRWED